MYKNLEDKSRDELLDLKDMVSTHTELTIEEKEANLKNINMYLKHFETRYDILEDIKAGLADIDDLME